MARKQVLTVASQDARDPIAFLVARCAITGETAAEWLARGAVRAGRDRVDATAALQPGMRVIVLPPPPFELPPVSVCHRDDDLLIVDKPAGLLTQPSPAESLSLSGLVAGEFPSARLAHRIDRDASGLVVFTLRAPAHGALQRAFAGGDVERRYIALCHGRVGAPIDVRLRIARDPDAAGRRRVLPEGATGGRAAHTAIEPLLVVERDGGFATLVAATLGSGRCHQIRAHLAALGHPLIGDRRYDGPPAERLRLHATSLALRHPTAGSPIHVVSPEPPGFRC